MHGLKNEMLTYDKIWTSIIFIRPEGRKHILPYILALGYM